MYTKEQFIIVHKQCISLVNETIYEKVEEKKSPKNIKHPRVNQLVQL